MRTRWRGFVLRRPCWLMVHRCHRAPTMFDLGSTSNPAPGQSLEADNEWSSSRTGGSPWFLLLLRRGFPHNHHGARCVSDNALCNAAKKRMASPCTATPARTPLRRVADQGARCEYERTSRDCIEGRCTTRRPMVCPLSRAFLRGSEKAQEHRDIVACGRRPFCAIEHIGIAAVGGSAS